VRAYGGSSGRIVLRRAARLPIVDEIEIACRCSFADMALVRARLASHDARIIEENFDAVGVCWRLMVPRDKAPELAERFADLTRGQGGWVVADNQNGGAA